jgi:hypothetical protein
MARSNFRKVLAIDLQHMDVIIDPDGKEATVWRASRVDHVRCRIETNLGVHVAYMDESFQVKQ